MDEGGKGEEIGEQGGDADKMDIDSKSGSEDGSLRRKDKGPHSEAKVGDKSGAGSDEGGVESDASSDEGENAMKKASESGAGYNEGFIQSPSNFKRSSSRIRDKTVFLKKSPASGSYTSQRKRRRKLSETLIESEEYGTHLSGGTSTNPIDIDLYSLLWEPEVVREFVSDHIFFSIIA